MGCNDHPFDEDSNTMSYFDDNEDHFTGMDMVDAFFGEPYRAGTSLHKASEEYNPNFAPQKESKMNALDMDEEADRLEKNAKRLAKEAKRVRKEAFKARERYDAFGKQRPVGTVVVFQKTYDTDEAPYRSLRNREQPVHYMYAAIRTKIGWTLTTTRAYAMDPKTWDELLDFIGDSPCAFATAFEDVQ